MIIFMFSGDITRKAYFRLKELNSGYFFSLKSTDNIYFPNKYFGLSREALMEIECQYEEGDYE